MGPVVAFPLGMAYGLGSALLFILSPKEMTPRSPPDLEDIDKTIRRGVGDQLDLADAQHAATYFGGAAEWLLRSGVTFKGLTGKDGAVPKHRADDFKRRLEEYVGGDQFQHNMDHMGHYPEKAKHILPALLMGIGAQLQLQWIHALVAQMDGDPITKADVQDLQDEV